MNIHQKILNVYLEKTSGKVAPIRLLVYTIFIFSISYFYQNKLLFAVKEHIVPLYYPLSYFALIISALFYLILTIKRVRDILSTRPESEVYSVSFLFFSARVLLSSQDIVILSVSLFITIALYVLPSNWCKSTIYKKYLRRIITSISTRIFPFLLFFDNTHKIERQD
jgi:hypothetical protein